MNSENLKSLFVVDPPLSRSSGGKNMVFLRNLSNATDVETLLKEFATFGNILSCKVFHEEDTKSGYGYVSFEDSFSAEKAIEIVNQLFLDQHSSQNYNEKNETSSDECNMTNIVQIKSDSLNMEDMIEKYKQIGKIVLAAQLRDEDNKLTKEAFVQFSTRNEAEKALKLTNNTCSVSADQELEALRKIAHSLYLDVKSLRGEKAGRAAKSVESSKQTNIQGLRCTSASGTPVQPIKAAHPPIYTSQNYSYFPDYTIYTNPAYSYESGFPVQPINVVVPPINTHPTYPYANRSPVQLERYPLPINTRQDSNSPLPLVSIPQQKKKSCVQRLPAVNIQ